MSTEDATNAVVSKFLLDTFNEDVTCAIAAGYLGRWVLGVQWTSLDDTRCDISLCPIVFLCLVDVDTA